MSLIDDMVYYRLNTSKYWRNISEWLIPTVLDGLRGPNRKLPNVIYGLEVEDAELLESINHKQRNMWRKKEVVPWQVFEVLAHWNLRGSMPRQKGNQKLGYLIEYLVDVVKTSPDPLAREMADEIYIDLNKSKIVPNYKGQFIGKERAGKLLEQVDLFRARRPVKAYGISVAKGHRKNT